MGLGTRPPSNIKVMLARYVCPSRYGLAVNKNTPFTLHGLYLPHTKERSAAFSMAGDKGGLKPPQIFPLILILIFLKILMQLESLLLIVARAECYEYQLSTKHS